MGANKRGWVHLAAPDSTAKVITTLCGMTGGRFQWTTRYQQSDCGKCRRIHRGE